MRTGLAFALVLAALALSGGCFGGVAQSRKELRVYADSSLGPALRDVAAAFETRSLGVKVVLDVGESAALRARLEQGARGEIFVTGRPAELERAAGAGLTAGQPVAFATNRLVLIAPAQSGPVTSLADLASPGVRLLLASAAIPAGADARTALATADGATGMPPNFSQRALANAAAGAPTGRQVAERVAEGEADAGIVYASDIVGDIAGRLRTHFVPAPYAPPATYYAVPLKEGKDYPLTVEFLAFLISSQGRSILARHGFQEATSR